MKLFPRFSLSLLVFAVCSVPFAYGQLHIHGENVPDWYDPSCCSNKDCAPVPDSDIEFGLNATGEPVVRHKPSGLEFSRERWKPSQDERYHVCYRPAGGEDEDGYPQDATAYCVYLRAGV